VACRRRRQTAAQGAFKRALGGADINGVSPRYRDLLLLRGRERPRELLLFTLFAFAASITLIWAWSWNAKLNDYGLEAATSFAALLHGHLETFLQTAPTYGASLLVRAPFALPGSLLHGGTLMIYRLSAVPCLLALAALGVWLARDLRRAGGSLLGACGVLAVCAANPITYRAMQLGHPEEVLGAALCVAAVLLAQRGHVSWAALALGIAIANKQWALLAVGPVLLAAPAGRWRILAIAGGVAIALMGPIALESGTLAAGTVRLGASSTGLIFNPQQIFWFFAQRGEWLPKQGILIPHTVRVPPAWLADRAHMIIVAAGVPLSWLALRRGSSRGDALLLLALLMLLRCWLDPWDVMYYMAPFVIALLAWETTVTRSRPLFAITATLATWVIFRYLPEHINTDFQALAFLIPSTLALALIAARVYGLVPSRRLAGPAIPSLTRAPGVPS
jgi:hypothetical protein